MLILKSMQCDSSIVPVLLSTLTLRVSLQKQANKETQKTQRPYFFSDLFLHQEKGISEPIFDKPYEEVLDPLPFPDLNNLSENTRLKLLGFIFICPNHTFGRT